MSGRCSCPECSTILRIRDRTFVGRRIHCPECKTALRIDEDHNRQAFVIHRLTLDELAENESGRRPTKKDVPKEKTAASSARSFVRRLIDSPLTVAWLIAIAMMTLVAVLTLAPKVRFTSTRPVPISPAAIQSPTNPETSESPATDNVDADIAPLTNETIDQREIPDAIISALEPVNIEGSLPIATPVETTTPAEVASDPPMPVRVDVEARLAQKLVMYKQSKPVSRRDLIEAFSEQLGAPIRYDSEELGQQNLDKTVTFELENTTIGGVIRTITDAAGWDIDIEATGLRLKGKQSPK